MIARFSASPSASFFSLDVQKIKTQTNKPEHKVFYVSFIPCFTFSTISHNSQVSVLSTISHNSQVFVLSTISHNSQVFVLSTIHPRLGFFSMQVTSSLPLSTCVPTFITISSCLFLTYSCILLHPFFLCSFCGFAGRVIRSVYKFLQSYYVF